MSLNVKLMKLSYLFFHIAALLFLLPLAFGQPISAIDLTRAVVVPIENASAPENKAVQMLIEEVERCSQVRWSSVNQAPNNGSPVISLSRASNANTLPPPGSRGAGRGCQV